MGRSIVTRIKGRLTNLADSLQGPNLGRGQVGELNFWRGALTPGAYLSETILNRLTVDGRKEVLPREIAWILEVMPHLERKRPWKALDVGSGPMSTLAYLQETGMAGVEAIDPLAEEYCHIMSEHQYGYPVLPRKGTAEELSAIFGDEVFDLVYSENALDHTQSPTHAFTSMVRVLKTGGLVMVKLIIREGSMEGWLGLHKFDLWPDCEALMCKSRFGRPQNLVAGHPLKHVMTVFSSLYGRSAFLAAYEKSHTNQKGSSAG